MAFLGPLTAMGAALLLAPRIEQRNVRVVWIGGGHWPVGGQEYNLSNDIHAANVFMRSRLEVWLLKMRVYRIMPLSHAELVERVWDKGAVGKYLVEQLIDWNHRVQAGPIEHRSLGDSPAIGVMMYPECGNSDWRPAPEYFMDMNYVHTGLMTPDQVHCGQADLVHSARQKTLDRAFTANPNRFVDKQPEPPAKPTAVWIDPANQKLDDQP